MYYEVLKALLRLLGAAELPSHVALHLKQIGRDYSAGEFADTHVLEEHMIQPPYVLLVIGEDITILNSLEHFWREQERFKLDEVETVLWVPKEIWEKIVPDLPADKILDLTKVPA